MSIILSSSVQFLAQLEKNNQREWFDQHREDYVSAKSNVESFAQSLAEQLSMDSSMQGIAPTYKIFRIFRDVRFSKNKLPFKTNFGIVLGGGDDEFSAQFYLHIAPKESFIGGGIYHPTAPHLQNIRQKIAKQYPALKEIISSSSFKKYFVLEGEQVKTAPKGYGKDHPAIDLLRYKDLIATRQLSIQEVLDKNFSNHCHTMFKSLYPFIHFLNQK